MGGWSSSVGALLGVRCPACTQARIQAHQQLCAGCRPLLADVGCDPDLLWGPTQPVEVAPFPPGLACGEYQGSLRRMILQAKQGPSTAALPVLRRQLLHAIRARKLPPGHLIAPPASRLRRWQGWHLADELAQSLAQRLGWPTLRPLRRRRERPPQAGLGAGARRINLAGSFAWRQAGWVQRAAQRRPLRRVYLIDDVLTTGATFRECARLFQQAGVEEVRPVVLAWVPDQLAASSPAQH